MKRIFFFVALLMLPVLAFGQAQTTGQVSGSIVGEDGSPIAEARVVLTSEALQGERTLTSAANGKFRAALLPAGMYTAEVSAPGYATQLIKFQISVGSVAPLDIVLNRGEEIVEELFVYSTPVALESTAIGETLNYNEDVEMLPIQNRTIMSVAAFAPNVSFGPTGNAQSNTNLSISGAPAYDTVVMLDGAEISDPYFGGGAVLYFEDAVQELQVLTSGISARYGRFQGGVINAITKSGGNEFAGTARWEFDNEDWDSRTPFGETVPDMLNNRYWLTIGGYAMKDHLWFFAGGRQIPETSTTVSSINPGGTFFPTTIQATRSTEEDRWQLKVRGAVNPNHVIEASKLDFESAQTPRAALPFVDARAGTGTRSDPRETTTLTYQGVLSPNVFLDFQATEKNVSIISGANIPTFGSPALDWTFEFCPGFCVYKNHWWGGTADPDVRDNETASLNFTQTINADHGTHTLEYGGGYVKSTTGGKNSQSVTGLNLIYFTADGDGPIPCTDPTDTTSGCTFDLDPAWAIERWNAPAVGVPPGGFEAEVEDVAFYVQDSFERGKFRIDAGLRFETYEGKGPLIASTVDFDDIAPRLGVTYNLDQNWQLQANWGKYVARINDNQSNSVTFVGENPSQTEAYTGPVFSGLSYDEVECVLRGFDPADTGGACDPTDPDVPFPGGFGPMNSAYWGTITDLTDPSNPTTFLAPGFEAPHANDLNLSIRRRLPQNTGVVTFTYTQRDFEDLTDDFVGGVSAFFPGVPDTTPIDTTGDGSLDGAVDTIIWGNASEARRRYQAITATFDYRPSPTWNIGANWTFSETTGNYEGEGRNTPGSGSEIGDYVRSRPGSAAVPEGFLDEDIRHRAQGWGSYRFDFERAGSLTLGGVLVFQSGRAWSQTASVAYADDPDYLGEVGGRYTHFFDGRGQNRFPSWWELSLSARYQFPIYKRLQGWFKADIRNVTNEDELVAFNTSGTAVTNAAGVLEFMPGGSFGSPDNQFSYQAARTYLFTLGLNF